MARTNQTTLTTPSDREIVLTRTFEAPRELMFKASTDPDLIPRWWGPRKYTTIVDKLDLRPGGAWRFINRDAQGNEFAFSGVYGEIVPPERLAYTFEFESMPGQVSMETGVLEEQDGKTKLTVTDLFDTVEDRDAVLQSGMEEGAAESQDRLADLLATLKEH